MGYCKEIAASFKAQFFIFIELFQVGEPVRSTLPYFCSSPFRLTKVCSSGAHVDLFILHPQHYQMLIVRSRHLKTSLLMHSPWGNSTVIDNKSYLTVAKEEIYYCYYIIALYDCYYNGFILEYISGRHASFIASFSISNLPLRLR